MNPAIKVFGREPVFWVSLIETAIALAITFGLHWSNQQVTLVMAGVNAAFGLYVAWATHDTWLAGAIGFVKAGLAIAVGFGLDLGVDKTAAIIAFISVALAAFNRTQTYPVALPPVAPPGVVPVADVGAE